MAGTPSDPAPIRRRWPILLAGIAATVLLLALGIWQVERRAWKLDLIARVEARIHAAPVPAPGPVAWRSFDDADEAYRRVTVRGRFDHDATTRVQALTALGGGDWLVTPLATDRGFTVLVNRGFVPAEGTASRPAGIVTVTGLLRTTEPGGGFLRANDPAADRWYSRDVAAIARRHRLGRVAPYFIDADAGPGDAPPVGGLTVIAFPNNHLVYAITWFVLAAMAAGATALMLRRTDKAVDGGDRST